MFCHLVKVYCHIFKLLIIKCAAKKKVQTLYSLPLLILIKELYLKRWSQDIHYVHSDVVRTCSAVIRACSAVIRACCVVAMCRHEVLGHMYIVQCCRQNMQCCRQDIQCCQCQCVRTSCVVFMTHSDGVRTYNAVVRTCSKQGGVIFEKKFGPMSCCSRLLRDPKSKISLCSVAFTPAKGLTGSQKILPVTLKSGGNCFLKFFTFGDYLFSKDIHTLQN